MEMLAILGLVAYVVGLAIMEIRSDCKYLDREVSRMYEMPNAEPCNRGIPDQKPKEDGEEIMSKVFKDEYYSIVADSEEQARKFFIENDLCDDEEELDLEEANIDSNFMFFPLIDLSEEYQDIKKYPRKQCDGRDCVKVSYREAMSRNVGAAPYILSVSSDLL